ncbi:hypothetical protein Tco_0822683 [Tanacetum coccineum]|uniref:Histone acetyltransferase n=1 Tax=Tanacetum coccineum TaxID=301880 RepID=A0ABQ5AKB2_9ASTR
MRYWSYYLLRLLGRYYPKRYWELLPKEILRAITQRETGMSYGKMELSKVEGDGEVKVMTRGFGDLVAKLDDKVVMEVLVRCWSDGDVVPTSVPVKWLSFTNHNSDEAQTSAHGVQNLRTFAISAITNSSDIESG